EGKRLDVDFPGIAEPAGLAIEVTKANEPLGPLILALRIIWSTGRELVPNLPGFGKRLTGLGNTARAEVEGREVRMRRGQVALMFRICRIRVRQALPERQRSLESFLRLARLAKRLVCFTRVRGDERDRLQSFEWRALDVEARTEQFLGALVGR